MWGLHRCNCGQIKDKKRTPTDFLQNSYQGSFSVRATIEAEDSLNSLHTKLHLPLQKHLTDRVLNERVLSVSHQKKEKRKSFRFRWQKWDFWVSHNCWQAREKGTSKEHLAPLAHIGGENAGSPNKTTSPAVRRHRCTQSRTSMFTFNSLVTARDRSQWRGATLLHMHFHYPQRNKERSEPASCNRK